MASCERTNLNKKRPDESSDFPTGDKSRSHSEPVEVKILSLAGPWFPPFKECKGEPPAGAKDLTVAGGLSHGGELRGALAA